MGVSMGAKGVCVCVKESERRTARSGMRPIAIA